MNTWERLEQRRIRKWELIYKYNRKYIENIYGGFNGKNKNRRSRL